MEKNNKNKISEDTTKIEVKIINIDYSEYSYLLIPI